MSIPSETVSEAAVPRRRENFIKIFLNRFATPFTTGLFIVSAVSGVALFFHWQGRIFHSMHEWLSMLLLLPFAFHLWKNWRTLLTYAKRNWLWIPLALSIVAAIPFAISAMSAGNQRAGNPAFRLMPLVTRAPLSALAPVLKATPEELIAKLEERGYQVESQEATLESIASAAGKQSSEVLLVLLPKQP